MIKTELESKDDQDFAGEAEAGTPEFRSLSRPAAWSFSVVSIIVVLAIGAIVYQLHYNSAPAPRIGATSKIGNVAALPIITGTSSTQAAPGVSGLNNNAINLQNNLPASGQGSTKVNSLQSSSNSALNTGQAINPNQPY
jgi:hypothetical protein